MITGRSIFKVFIGSFFIQSSWSFKKMQGLGFAAAINPALNDIYTEEGEPKRAALKRQMVYYNAHPYMASPILGAVINIEERASRSECDPSIGVKLKSALMAPYGAIGDMFFWGGIRPLASCLGIMTALLWGLWGPVVFLAVYNLFHLWMRWRGLTKGYELGPDVVGYIKDIELPRRSVTAHNITAGVLGVVAAIFAWSFVPLLTGVDNSKLSAAGLVLFIFLLGVVMVATPLLARLLRRGLSVMSLIYVVVLPLMFLGIVFY